MAKFPIKDYASTLKLNWAIIPARKPQVVAVCGFCKRGILDTEEYREMVSITNEEGTAVFTWSTGSPEKACRNCATEAGLEW